MNNEEAQQESNKENDEPEREENVEATHGYNS
jgi:hypothetical protein